MRVKLFDLMFALSSAMDLMAPELNNHHQQVAYLSYRLAREMGLGQEDALQLLMAGVVHDIGALSLRERLALAQEEQKENSDHAFRGAALLAKYEPFAPLAAIVRFHHLPWSYGQGTFSQGENVPIASHILHLADRVCALFKPRDHILLKMPEVLPRIQAGEGARFLPEGVAALTRLAFKVHVWLELGDREPLGYLKQETDRLATELNVDQTLKIAEIFSRIIDFRNRYMATHSFSVGQAARMLGEMSGMSSMECDMLLIAGYLHDMGKITIDDEILEKPGRLSPREFQIVRTHPFYTYQLLSRVPGLETIAEWAAYHHEKLNGNGYPFHLGEKSLSYGARVVAVADIFAAITEKRPYRDGMTKDQGMKLMRAMVNNGSVSREATGLLLANYDLYVRMLEEGQRQAMKLYEEFSGPAAEESVPSSGVMPLVSPALAEPAAPVA